MLYIISKNWRVNTYGARLSHALAVRQRDRAWLSEQIGLSVQATGQVIRGDTKQLAADNHERAAIALNGSGLWLAAGEGEMERESQFSYKNKDLKATVLIAMEDMEETELTLLAGMASRLVNTPKKP